MKIGLALSGGGALGAAHIGVLEEIEKNKIEINYICGVSAGAIIGLVYADQGMKGVEELYRQLENYGLFNKANLIFKRNSTIFSTIEKTLRGLVSAKNFSDLQTRFSCIATDIRTGDPINISYGDPVKAVMASAAYPGVFPIQEIDGQYFIDGGVSQNLPASQLREAHADFIIGSSVYDLTKIEEIGDGRMSAFSIVARALDIIQKNLSEYEKASCDFCFLPPTEDYRWYRFDHVDKLREAGRIYAASKMPELIHLIKLKNPNKGFWQTLFGG